MTKFITVENKTKRIGVPARIKFCNTFLTQLRGFTFRSRLLPTEGLLLVGKRDSRVESSIHMFFVSFDLAVFWINAEMKIVDKLIAKTWRPAYFSKQPAKYVLELHPDHWGDYEIGDAVQFQDA